jgi:hypothetical protein
LQGERRCVHGGAGRARSGNKTGIVAARACHAAKPNLSARLLMVVLVWLAWRCPVR